MCFWQYTAYFFFKEAELRQSETVRFFRKSGIGENPFFRGILNLIYNFL
jgi:hypothetical protein